VTTFYRAYRAAIMRRAAEAITNPRPKPGLGVWSSCPDYGLDQRSSVVTAKEAEAEIREILKSAGVPPGFNKVFSGSVNMTSILYCPFCGDEIAREDLLSDHDVTEDLVAAHIASRHPIRRRLNRKMHRAFKLRAANLVAAAYAEEYGANYARPKDAKEDLPGD
jgi:hypothetical protein